MKQLVILCVLLFGCANAKATEHKTETIEKQNQTSAVGAATTNTSGACPAEMVEVRGDYCPTVEQKCLKWLDEDQSPEANGGIGPMRCAEFEQPSKCLSSQRVHMHFCMSKFEYPGTEGSYPIVDLNYYQAKKIAADRGYRLPTKAEFNFACEGPDMHPYGYGDGFHRDATICNIDKPWVDYNKYPRSTWNDHVDGGLNQSIRSDGNSKCKSWSGVINLNGNVDEILDSEFSKNVILSGGYWSVVRNRCRPLTDSHSKEFSFYQISFRMVKDIR